MIKDLNGLLDQRFNQEDLQKVIRSESFYHLPKGASPQYHSKKIDRFLGHKIGKVENKLAQKYRIYDGGRFDGSDKKQHFQGTEAWIGLNTMALQTPYNEIYSFLKFFNEYPLKRIVDFGAAYGRMAMVMAAVMPEVEFLGYEIVRERIKEARRIFEYYDLENASICYQNLLDDDFSIPQAEVYFIYDFSRPSDVRQILKKIERKYLRDKFFLVARGEGIRTMIQYKFPTFWRAHGGIHHKEFSIFSSFTDLRGKNLLKTVH